MLLYHGSNSHGRFQREVYFSTSLDFSKDYGDVKQYEVRLENLFDTLNETHVRQLFEVVGSLYEPYDEVVFNNYEEYLSSSFYGCDNWEMFEQYIRQIKSLGFDSMRIFEGGYENYCAFHKNFEMIA